MSKKGLGKFLLGASIGTGIGMLISNKTGKENREQLKAKIDDLINKAKNINSKELINGIEKKTKEIKEGLSDLDKEKVLSIAKQKSEDIKVKLEELVKLSIDKGTPIVEKSASIVKEKTIDLMKHIIDKLEQEEK